MSERTPCEEHGHDYEQCPCMNGNCKLRVCNDCGDGYDDE